MADTLTLLDQALELGRKELGFLVAGDVEEARRLAGDRGRLTFEAVGEPGVDLAGVLEKLNQLQSLQGQITQEARRLHAALTEDLKRARQENRRFSAYREGSGRGRTTTERYVSRQG